ncbi:putative capsule polysaccharide synthase protein [Eutypa lata UCREL1]|uniref:Putative capsule polysaccharide synthase protein n=1 Tax=Eutypa lata (strain UCR-EL1) TaxID=1287681 RepID=M7T0V4_EUTLA|nr:putative capsule polysaccharide synthase protein [Eutypa lata UCREL1]
MTFSGYAFYQILGYYFTSGVDPNIAFLSIFGLRYTRVLVHSVVYFFYRAAPVPAKPSITAGDVTVVVATIDPTERNFIEAIASICRTGPNTIIVVTVGAQREASATQNLALLQSLYPNITFRITHTAQANKRQQIALAAGLITTPITFLVDASVFWNPNFLTSALAAFEDATVYLVGTNKRVQLTTRDNLDRLLPLGFIFNFFGSTYLSRHNFEIRASNTMDGGLFAVSGRTLGIRTKFLQDQEIMKGFTNERVSNYFGSYIPALNQPLLPDDDNYLTRQVFNKGHKVKIQYTEDARVEIAGGQFTYPRYLDQCLRWARSTFRSNVASLVTERMALCSPGLDCGK